MLSEYEVGWKMKWAVWNEVRRLFWLPLIRLYFLIMGVTWGRDWRVFGFPLIQKIPGSQIIVGDGVILRSWLSSNPVAPFHRIILSTRSEDATIQIGDEVGISGGSIIALDRIVIGNRVLIGSNCLIADTDFHPLSKDNRVKHPRTIKGSPITIGDDVFIGTRSIILKGTRIGEGSIIGAGSVVTGDIPPNVIAAGNPAVVIRRLGDGMEE
jgi:acetyltransferase-like isoleucine patch superfamily enzyme